MEEVADSAFQEVEALPAKKKGSDSHGRAPILALGSTCPCCSSIMVN